ncbi:MFS transporter [Micromonospora sp. NPDC003197]
MATGATGIVLPEAHASTIRRARQVLALGPFRRLWIVTGFCSAADWLALLSLAALAGLLAESATGANVAFSTVLFANLLPGLLFAPIGGLLADRFNRRVIMVIADLVRAALLLSIVIVGSYWWIFAGTFLIQAAAIMWIPSKDAALPNLLRRPDQMEPATQLGLIMTYGIAVLVGGGLFTLITGAGTTLHLPPEFLDAVGLARIAVVVAALFYLTSAIIIAIRLPELSQRPMAVAPVGDDPQAQQSTSAAGARNTQPSGPGGGGMLRDSAAYIRRTPLVRGLLVGLMGAFAAGGAIVGVAQTYALSLLGGQAAFGLLLLSIFAGLVVGLLGAPKLARRLPHDRVFGIAIVSAGAGLVPVAFSPHLAFSMLAVAVVGACAGTAFLTGTTIIGSRVEDAMRGRINALYQSMLKVVAGCSVVVAPLLVTLVKPRTVTIWDSPIVIDGTRPVILSGGLLAALVGVIAYRQMTAAPAELAPPAADVTRPDVSGTTSAGSPRPPAL